MMKSTLLLVLLPFTVQVHAQSSSPEAKEVLAVVDRFFAAMTARDTTAMAQLIVREGVLQVADLDGAKPARTITNGEYLRRLAIGTERFVERYWNEQVHLFGTMATVDMAYDFHVDGKFSHCGTDIFTLVKGPDGWRIANVVYTRQVEGCGESPLGPLKN